MAGAEVEASLIAAAMMLEIGSVAFIMITL